MVVEGGSTGSRAAKKRKLATHSAPRRADQTEIQDVESLESRTAHELRVVVSVVGSGGEEECVSVPFEGGGGRRNQHGDTSPTH
jgi:hypothetical protein